MTEKTINWQRLHAAASAVDATRGRAGHDGVFDAFGGSYYPNHYQSRGLAGLHSLACAAAKIRHAVWDAIHQASTHAAVALVERPQDGAMAHWSVDCSGRPDRCHRSHRGAAWRATHYGGRVEYREAPHGAWQRAQAAEQRHEAVIAETRKAVATAFALHELYQALDETGIVEYSPEQEICGVTDTLQVTGLRWLVGERREDSPVSASAARAFCRDGLPALRTELDNNN